MVKIMIRHNLLLLVSIVFIVTSCLGCGISSKVPEPQTGYKDALIVAATNIPYEVYKQGAFMIMTPFDGNWTIHFSLSGNVTVTKEALNWVDDSSTTYANHGLLPDGSFRLLTFVIAGTSGSLLSRRASDSFILGPPDAYYNPPSTLDFWWAPLVAALGVLTGGTIMWLIMHRRRSTDVTP